MKTSKKVKETPPTTPQRNRGTSISRPMWWLLLMFAAAIAYLVPEAIFNAKLVSVAGDKESNPMQLERVELFGRFLSGIGVSLLLSDWLLSGSLIRTPPRAFISISIVFLLVWPTVFFGQKWAVNQFLIDTSLPKERQNAFFSQVLRNAIATNTVEIAGIPFDPEQKMLPSDFTFLTILGGLLFADNTLMDTIDAQKEAIVENHFRNIAIKEFDSHYAQYRNLRTEVESQFDNYADESDRYNLLINEIPDRAAEYWAELQATLQTKWDSYQQAVLAFDARIDVRAQKIAPEIHGHFKKKAQCNERYSKRPERRESCLSNLDKEYDQLLAKYSITRVDPGYWLIVEDVSTAENIASTALAAAATGGASLIGQGLSALLGGDGGWKDKDFSYTNDVSHYHQRLLLLKRRDFAKDHSGIPYGLDRKGLYNDPSFAQQVRSDLRKKYSLNMRKNWFPTQRKEFNIAASKRIRDGIDSEWSHSAKIGHHSIAPNLSWEQFQVHPGIQAGIAQKVGPATYVVNMRFDWNNTAFLKHAVEPNIRKHTEETLTRISANAAHFSDGGEYETVGKTALRATLVPPISMTLSLFLILLTTIKLPSKAADIINFKRNLVRSDDQPKLRKTAKKIGVGLALISLLITIPLLFMDDRFSKDGSSVTYFLDKVHENSSPIYAHSLNWVLNTQPKMLPLGDELDTYLNIFDRFAPVSTMLGGLDKALFDHDTPANDRNSRPLSRHPLSIITTPPNARIRIMNIEPKYSPNIQLEPGAYDVEVSYSGYATKREWIKLGADETEFHFELRPL